MLALNKTKKLFYELSYRLSYRLLATLAILLLFGVTPLTTTKSWVFAEQSTAKKISNLLKQGKSASELGENRTALTVYQQALALAQTSSDRAAEIETLDRMGKIYYETADYQQALETFQRELPLVRGVADRKQEGRLLNSIGKVYLDLGDFTIAIDYYNQALPHQRSVKDRSEEAYTLAGIARANLGLGDGETALEYFNKTLVIRRGVQDRKEEAWTLHNIGVVYASLNQYKTAINYYDQSLAIRQAINDRKGEGNTLHNLAVAYEAINYPKMALNFYEKALDVRRDVDDNKGVAVTLYRHAQLLYQRGQVENAQRKIEEAIKIVEELRTRLRAEELRTAYFATVQELYEFYIKLLMDQRDKHPELAAQAFQVSERARARGLLDLLVEARAEIRQGVDPALLTREQQLQEKLNAKADRLIKLKADPQKRDTAYDAEKEVNALQVELQSVESEIKSRSPQYAFLTQPQPLTLKEVQQQILDDETLLLEYALGAEQSYLWAISQNSFNVYTLPKRADLELMARKAYQLVTARNGSRGILVQEETLPANNTKNGASADEVDREFQQSARALSEVILLPVQQQLKGQAKLRRLAIVADGVLQYLPFAALPVPGDTGEAKPLIVDFEVVNLPSASTFAYQRRTLARRAAPSGKVAVIADPVFENGDERLAGNKSAKSTEVAQRGLGLPDTAANNGTTLKVLRIPRLPGTRQEAEQILKLADKGKGEVKSYFDFDANRQSVLGDELAKYQIIHFATHGLADSEHPALSAVLLSMYDRQGQSQNGFLRAHEIYNLNLPAELVVLSACETGLGKEVRGEGLVGLTRGFMYAGAERVVVSLWSVNDAATAELMSKFYQGILGEKKLTPAAALRAAQVAMWQEGKFRAPFYWAAFQLQGEWQQ